MASHADFQNQFSLMMGKLLHSAVKETTKLFDTTVQNMITELARLRKQNDMLKGNLLTDDDDTPSPNTLGSVGCSKRDVGVQCDAPTTASQVERSCSPLDPAALPPNALQNGKGEFAIVSVKEEEPDTYDETQTCLFTKISEDQPRQLLVHQHGEASLESSLIPVKPAAFQPHFQATRGRPTVALTHLTSSELTATQQGTLTLRQPTVKVSSTTPQQQGTMTSPQKRKKGAVTWTRHQGVLTLTQPTDAPLALTLSQPKVTVSSTTPQQQGTGILPQKQKKGAVTWTRHQSTLTLTQPTDALALSSSPPLPAPGSSNVEDEGAPAQVELLLEECDLDGESTDSQLSSSDLPRTSSRQTRSTYRRLAKSMTPPAREAGRPEALSDVHRKSPKDSASVAEKPHGTEEPRQKNQCDVCDRILSSTTALECHRRIHSGERPCVCERCGKGFADGRGLRRHLLTHNPKRHQCNDCGKTFIYGFGLRSHQLTHTSVTEYECKVCGKGFKCKATLATHMRLHTGEKPFSCSVCFKKFRHRGTYNIHMQRHRGEKRYVCSTCEKSFADPNNLKAHNRVHTGERPYQCNICDKKFKQTSHLKKHMAGQH